MRFKRKHQDRVNLGICIVLLTLLTAKLPGPQRQYEEITNPLLLQLRAITRPLPERKERAFYLSLINDKKIVDELYKYKGLIDLDLLAALIWSESRFKPTALNKNKTTAGVIKSVDSGLLQLNSASYPNHSLEELQKIETNIALGVQHFQKDLLFFKGDVKKALQAFNAGRTGVLKNPKISSIYAKKVIDKAIQFKVEKAAFISKSL